MTTGHCGLTRTLVAVSKLLLFDHLKTICLQCLSTMYYVPFAFVVKLRLTTYCVVIFHMKHLFCFFGWFISSISFLVLVVVKVNLCGQNSLKKRCAEMMKHTFTRINYNGACALLSSAFNLILRMIFRVLPHHDACSNFTL